MKIKAAAFTMAILAIAFPALSSALPANLNVSRVPSPQMTTAERAAAATRLMKTTVPPAMSAPVSLTAHRSSTGTMSLDLVQPAWVRGSDGLVAMDQVTGSRLWLNLHKPDAGKAYIVTCYFDGDLTADWSIQDTAIKPPKVLISGQASTNKQNLFVLVPANLNGNKGVRVEISIDPASKGTFSLSGCDVTAAG